MANSEVIPFTRRDVSRRTIEIKTPLQPTDLTRVLEMLNSIDPALLSRITSHSSIAAAGPRIGLVGGKIVNAEDETHVATTTTSIASPDDAIDDLPCPPPPANTEPHLPRHSHAARARTLTSLIFTEGSAAVLTGTSPSFQMVFCLR